MKKDTTTTALPPRTEDGGPIGEGRVLVIDAHGNCHSFENADVIYGDDALSVRPVTGRWDGGMRSYGEATFVDPVSVIVGPYAGGVDTNTSFLFDFGYRFTPAGKRKSGE